MTLKDIQDVVYQGEGLTIEFKRSTGQLERGMETLCAFLNRNGGTLLFGVSDKGDIIGQNVSDTTRQDIAERISNIQPSVTPKVEYIKIHDSDRYVIAIYVEPIAHQRPFYYKHMPYFRIESTTIRMPEDILEDMVMIKGGKRYIWEGLPAEGVSLDDIDYKLVIGTVQLGIYNNRLPESVATKSTDEILKGLHLYTHDGKLTNAAMVLFGKNLMPRYPQCLLRMARFKGTKVTDDFVDNRQVHGNVFVIFDAAMSFFVKHLNISGSINVNTWRREDDLDIPRIALRESIINACAHRLYHRNGSSISIAIFDDRIEIGNTGSFPIGLTEANILSNDRSEPLNPIIANVLYKTSYLEHWGRGIKLMHEACVKRGLKAPSFATDGHTVTITFFLSDDTDVTINDQNVTINDQDVTINDQNVTINIADVTNDDDLLSHTSLRRKEILSQIELHPRTTAEELATLLRVSKRTILRDLDFLQKTGVISRKGSNKTGEWLVN